MGRRPRHGVRARRPGEVVEADAQHDGAPDPAGRSHAAGDAIDHADQDRVDLRRATSPSGPGPAANRSSRGGARPARGRGSRLWASAWSWWPDARPSIDTSAGSGICATSPTVVMPRSRSLAAVIGPTPHSRSTGQRVEERQLLVGRDHEQAVGLGHAARHLGEELRAGHADGDGQADLLADVAPQPHGDLGGRSRHPPQAAHVEEGLVDRQPFDQRRGVLEHLEHRLAGLGVGRHAGRDHDGPGAQPPGQRAAHRRADAEGPGLVAGRQHHARRRRSPAGPGGGDRRAARPRRRRRRGRRGGSWRHRTRTHVRTRVRASRRVGGWRRSVPSLDGVRHHRGARRR